jgi:hypothetical protein
MAECEQRTFPFWYWPSQRDLQPELDAAHQRDFSGAQLQDQMSEAGIAGELGLACGTRGELA